MGIVMDWGLLQHTLPQLYHGTLMTLWLLISSIVIGLLFSMALVAALHTKNRIIYIAIKTYLYIFRGTPMLVQFFIIYFGAGQFEFITHSFLWVIFKQPVFCAIITLTLNTAAYTTVLLKGAVDALPKSEILAGQAYGMNNFLIAKNIIFPNVIRVILPAYSNEVVMVLKGTSLASAITVTELTNVRQSIIGETYQTIEFLTVAAIIYLLLNCLIIGLFKYINQHLLVNPS